MPVDFPRPGHQPPECCYDYAYDRASKIDEIYDMVKRRQLDIPHWLDKYFSPHAGNFAIAFIMFLTLVFGPASLIVGTKIINARIEKIEKAVIQNHNVTNQWRYDSLPVLEAMAKDRKAMEENIAGLGEKMNNLRGDLVKEEIQRQDLMDENALLRKKVDELSKRNMELQAKPPDTAR
jgi:hypothetical protein